MQRVSATTTRAAQVRPRSLVRAWPWLAAMAITLLALGLRLWTIRRALPYVDHPDEPNPVEYVVQMLRSGDLNPHAFQKPSLYIYLLLAVASLHYRWGRASGLYTSLDQMLVTTHLYTTIPGFFMAGRALTALIGSLTALALFVIGRRMWSISAGLFAALLLAVSPFHLRHSQYVTTDVTSGLFVLLTFGAALLAARRGAWPDYLLAGLCAGLAASTKYNAGVAVLMVATAHLLRHGRRLLAELPRLLAAGAAATLGFLIGTPYALLSWPEFSRGLAGQWGDYSANEHGDFVGAWNLRGYSGFFRRDGLGATVCAALVVGLLVLLRRRRDMALIWLSFTVPYLLLHLAQSSHFTRNMIPLVVLCTLLAGVGAAAMVELLMDLWEHHAAGLGRAPFMRHTLQIGLVLALMVALALPGTLESASHTARMLRGDTRVHALAWINANVPPAARIAAELRPLPSLTESRWTAVRALPDHDLAWYRRQGYAYLLASSDAWKQWPIPPVYKSFAGQPLVAFGGADPRDMLGPRVLIYPTGLTAADVSERPAGNVRFGAARFLGAALGRPLADAPQLGVEPGRIFQPGGVLGLRTFWQVEQPFDQDYFLFVHILDRDGRIVAQRDTPPWQGRFPTSSWHPGSIVVDVNDLPLPATLAPGEYTIILGMFSPSSGAHPALTIDGQPSAGNTIPLGTLKIEP